MDLSFRSTSLSFRRTISPKRRPALVGIFPTPDRAVTAEANGHARNEENDRLALCDAVSTGPYRPATGPSFDGRSAAVVLKSRQLHSGSLLLGRRKSLAETPGSAGPLQIAYATRPARSLLCAVCAGTTAAVDRYLTREATALGPTPAADESPMSFLNATRPRASEDIHVAAETSQTPSPRTLKHRLAQLL